MKICPKNKHVAILCFVIFAMLSIWLASRGERYQNRIASGIIRRGGNVTFDYQYSPDGRLVDGTPPPGPLWIRQLLVPLQRPGDVVSVDLRSVLADEKLLSDVSHLPYVHFLQLDFDCAKPLTDDRLHYLCTMSELKTLCLTGPAITDRDLSHLCTLTWLETLDLSRTNVTGHGTRCLAELPRLTQLDFTDSAANDEGMESVGRLRHLDVLDLSGTRVSDCGLESLFRLSKLKMLRLLGTDTTGPGIKRLSRALPECYMVTTEEWGELEWIERQFAKESHHRDMD